MLESSRFVTTEQWSSRRTEFASPIRVSIFLFQLPSLMNTIPRYLNVFTCYSVLPHTCRIQCLGRLEKHNASILLVVIFVPAWLHAAENRSNACWRPCCEDPRLQYQFARKKQTGHPAVRNSDTLVDASVTVCPSYVQPATRMWPSRKFCAAQLGFRCSKRILRTDNLSLFW